MQCLSEVGMGEYFLLWVFFGDGLKGREKVSKLLYVLFSFSFPFIAESV